MSALTKLDWYAIERRHKRGDREAGEEMARRLAAVARWVYPDGVRGKP